MFLHLIVVINLWGVKCDIKTDFPKSGHDYAFHGFLPYKSVWADQNTLAKIYALYADL